MLFGCGSADQLGGVLSQIMGSRILVELMSEGVMRGVIPCGYITVAEEDNDGGGPVHHAQVLPGAPPEMIPDVVILTDSTGDSTKGALRIYRGQRGRMQIEVKVTGRSWPRLDAARRAQPAEYGAAILKEAAEKHAKGVGFPITKCSTGHAHRVVVASRHAERLRRAGLFHVPLRPPLHDRRDAGSRWRTSTR